MRDEIFAPAPPLPPRRGVLVLQNSSKEQNEVPKTHLVIPGDSLEMVGCRNGSAVDFFSADPMKLGKISAPKDKSARAPWPQTRTRTYKIPHDTKSSAAG